MTENHNALPTLREIWAVHSWKRDYEKYLPISRFVFRPLGFLLTWVAIRAGLTTEAVSWVSGVVGIAGCLFLVSGSVELLPLGLALLLFFNLLDCVDGSIARTMRTENPYGRFLDSTCGGAIDLAFWGIIGIIAFQHQALLISPRALGYPPLLWLAIGAATCYLSILVGYIERTYSELLKADWDRIKSTKQEPAMKVARVVGLEAKPIFATTGRISGVIRIINNNLRVRETHYFLLLFAVNYRTIDLLLAVYLVYYLSHTLLLLVIYSKRGKIIRKLY